MIQASSRAAPGPASCLICVDMCPQLMPSLRTCLQTAGARSQDARCLLLPSFFLLSFAPAPRLHPQVQTVGSGYIQLPPQKRFEGGRIMQPPTVSVSVQPGWRVCAERASPAKSLRSALAELCCVVLAD